MTSIPELDNDIAALNARISSLRARRANLASILLSSPHLAARLQPRPGSHESARKNASRLLKQQENLNRTNTYRTCAGVTAFKVQDPDPNAVDNGNVLGVRIEVFVKGKFIETYHVLLNRPHAERHKGLFKIHRHTIPACIPVKQLAGRYLPQLGKDQGTPSEQQLVKFGKELRRELVGWHLRRAAVEKLRVEAGLDSLEKEKEKKRDLEEPGYGQVLNAFVSDDEEEEEEDDGIDDDEYEEDAVQRRRQKPVRIVDIDADFAVREIHVAWSNGRTAALNVAKDGEITGAVVKTSDGVNVPRLARQAVGRIEGLIQRLAG